MIMTDIDGWNIPMKENPTPLNFFELNFTNNVVELCATETNQYVTDFLHGNLRNLEDPYTHTWTDVEVVEMKTSDFYFLPLYWSID